jgi:hypothetical protein
MTTWDKVKHKEYDARRYALLREYIDNIKSASGCLVCGETTAVCLDFHHLDPSKKSFGLARVMRSKEKLVAEIEKCIVLCANCHRKLHNNLIILPV